MRIGIDYTPATEEGAGIGRFTHELVAALVAEDETNEYVLMAPRNAAPPDWLASSRGARWAPLPMSAHMAAVLWQRLRLPAPVEWFTGPIDLFHATDYVLPPLRSAKGLVTIHDLSFLRYPEYADPHLVHYLAEAVPRAVTRATLVLTDSEATREDVVTYLHLPPEKVSVVYGGVSEAFRPIQEQEALEETRDRYALPPEYLLSIGRLEPRKNLPGLLRAYRMLLDRGQTSLPLAIGGGKGWGYEPIFQAVEDLELKDSVRFLGYVQEQDLPPLLSGAATFVYPSFYEGFGLPPLEAMACGTPVVASNSSCLPEVLGDAALLVPPDETEALAEAIALLLSDEALRRDLRERGLERARRFSWTAAARQLLAAYGQAMNTSTALTSR